MSAESPNADYSLRILWSLARWIEDVKGKSALDDVAQTAGVKGADFDGSTRWVSHEQFEKILAAARELAGSDDVFMEACAYRFQESYGSFRHMIWALSPKQLYESAVKLAPMLTRGGRFEILRSERSKLEVRYISSNPETRLMCLSRQVQWRNGPRMWGLPSAQLREVKCIANGDDCCEYHLRWFEVWRIVPVIVGAALGAAAAFAVAHLPVGNLSPVTLPVLGAALGYTLELRRMHRTNVKLGEEMNQSLRTLGEAEAEARSEIVALQERQRDWIRLMEQQVAERTTTLERVVDGLEGIQKSRVTTLRGFSHDLRNPLFVLKGNTQFLLEHVQGADSVEALRDMETAASQIELMLQNLMELATQETGFVKLAPRRIAIPPLGEVFRRRLRALVIGRDIKVSAFCTREAPESIEIDPLVFDRIVDNLLTNAAKYTQRGSIVLEITGTPGAALSGELTEADYLTLKLSDTGQGIAPEQVERIFRPRPASEPSSPQSYGIGLSSAVRLLAQVGGRIDVMSKPGVGTTFWAHFPTKLADSKRVLAGDDNMESMITRVVTIRKVEGS